MAEFKLYKCPSFVKTWRTVPNVFNENEEYIYYRDTNDNVFFEYENANYSYPLLKIHRLQPRDEVFVGRARWDIRWASNVCIVRNNRVLHDLRGIKDYNTQAENRAILRNLNIKGRTKLVKQPKAEIIRAIMKQT